MLYIPLLGSPFFSSSGICSSFFKLNSHFLLFRRESNLGGGDELFSRSHPQDGAVVALHAVGQAEGGQGTPRQSQAQERTLLKQV